MDLKNTKRSEMYKNRKEDLLVQSIKQIRQLVLEIWIRSDRLMIAEDEIVLFEVCMVYTNTLRKTRMCMYVLIQINENIRLYIVRFHFPCNAHYYFLNHVERKSDVCFQHNA